jgi:hypothetical protein
MFVGRTQAKKLRATYIGFSHGDLQSPQAVAVYHYLMKKGKINCHNAQMANTQPQLFPALYSMAVYYFLFLDSPNDATQDACDAFIAQCLFSLL